MYSSVEYEQEQMNKIDLAVTSTQLHVVAAQHITLPVHPENNIGNIDVALLKCVLFKSLQGYYN